ncbi:MAG: HPr family phosphocarrier protein [Planctomycetota bacterium]|nr:MAG: HPr family phosphocarrier protein [Planctomycetota bacterium]
MAADPTESVTVRIVNRQGLHARPISEFVKVVGRHRARVTVRGPGGEADGASVLQMMGLMAPLDSELMITAAGDDRLAVLAALSQLVAAGFGEA